MAGDGSGPQDGRSRALVQVVYAEATAPVVQSQCVPLLRAWRETGHHVEAAVFTSPRRLLSPSAWVAHRQALAAFEEAAGRPPLQRTHPPREQGLERLGRVLAKDLRRRGVRRAFLLCRQPRAALIGIAASREAASRGDDLAAVLDLRGIRDVEYLNTLDKQESELTPDETARLAAYRRQEETAVRDCRAVLSVSGPMRTYLGRRYGIAAERLGVVPNHATAVSDAESLRAGARGELSVEDDEVLVAYCGTLAAWQMVDASCLLMRALARRDGRFRGMFITPQVDTARDALRRAGWSREELGRVVVRSAAPAEVHRLLAAADYGLLLRQADAVNRVACPVKFGEYLAAGVRPILTPGIGEQSELIGRTNLGVVIPPDDVEQAARRIETDAGLPHSLGADGRDTRRAWAAEHIAPERAARRIVEFLDTLDG